MAETVSKESADPGEKAANDYYQDPQERVFRPDGDQCDARKHGEQDTDPADYFSEGHDLRAYVSEHDKHLQKRLSDCIGYILPDPY